MTEEPKENKLKQIFAALPMPNAQDLKKMEQGFKMLSMFLSVLPPIEFKEVVREFSDGTKKPYLAIYIEKPQKEAKPCFTPTKQKDAV